MLLIADSNQKRLIMLAQFVSLCKIPGFSGGKIPEWEPVIVREGRREEEGGREGGSGEIEKDQGWEWWGGAPLTSISVSHHPQQLNFRSLSSTSDRDGAVKA